MKKILIGLLILSVFLLGCTQQNQSTSAHYKFTGNDVIDAQFSIDAPDSTPGIYFDDDAIPLEVELVNKGYKDIKKNDVALRLRGVVADPQKFKATKPGVVNPLQDLLAISEDGSTFSSVADVGDINSKQALVEAEYKPLVELDVCYKYDANVITDLFVTDNPEKMKTIKIKQGDNPPSPVQVISLKQMPAQGNKVRFDFVVKNVGVGKVVDKCFETEEVGKKKEEWVKVSSPSGVTCKYLTNGKVKLRNREGRVSCEMGYDPTNLNYMKPVQIDLGVVYEKTIAREISISKAL